MRLTNNEKGYSLLLTMFVFILFTVLAMALLTATLTGSKRNQTSEHNIQAQELAMMGIDHLTNQINKDLKAKIPENGIDKVAFKKELEKVLITYQSNPVQKSLSTGAYKTKIYSGELYEENNNQKAKVVIESKGTVNGKVKTIKATVVFGAQTTLDDLKYTVSSYISGSCKKYEKIPTGNTSPCIDGEGNLFLHGGVEITGDIKVDRHLVTANHGYARYNYWGSAVDKWIPSVYPRIKATEGNKNPQIVLGGNIYTFSPEGSYNTHINMTNFENVNNEKRPCRLIQWFLGLCKKPGSTKANYTNVTDHLENAFLIKGNDRAPVIVQKQQTVEDIKIEEMKSSFKFNQSSQGVPSPSEYNGLLGLGILFSFDYYKEKDLSNSNVYANGKTTRALSREKNELYFFGNNKFGRFSTDGDLIIRNESGETTTTNFKNGAYIGENLEIGKLGWLESNLNPNTFEEVQLDGPIYVNGDVHIEGIRGEFNSIMYVNGSVTIEDSVINGLNNGSLIIFAKGDINIHNISINKDTPSKIKGFFYSEKDIEIYGVGSNIKIEGGISARRVVLNAIRGSANIGYLKDYFEPSTSQPSKNSRLQIIYDPEIMNTYSNLKAREPMVMSVDEPTIIERKVD
ncbi:hypothetical protein NST54_12755 [Caldifermentibacillus hisashii]|uniref:hypothetical protein n=1 Tax=Caldifermentibacillus hisashii TaxID=996558 RepID=UPI001C0F3D22|nr:hypothetical protein [Caldifermentibacillus hisashii]MBU5342598.1 hypothetical protein [Caldifermentibacillus hisashii]